MIAETENLFDGVPEQPELACRWCIWQTNGVGYKTFRQLLEFADGDLLTLLDYTSGQLRRVLSEQLSFQDKTSKALATQLIQQDPLARYRRELEALPPEGKIIHLGDDRYPGRFLDLEKPPLFLYVRGSCTPLLYPETVSMVGSRKATPDGVELAEKTAKDLGDAGISVVSGGAIGVDAAAHRGGLRSDTPTICVLPCSIESPRPMRNGDLFRKITNNGSLVSEYPIGTGVRRYRFHRRNRLIAALGDGVLIVRATEKSGTMITAEAATDIGRPLAAFPGPIDEPLVQGNLKLLASGAQCVRNSSDLEEAFFQRLPKAHSGHSSALDVENCDDRTAQIEDEKLADLTQNARQVLDMFDTETANCAKHFNRLLDETSLTKSELSEALLELELSGLIIKVKGSQSFQIPM